MVCEAMHGGNKLKTAWYYIVASMVDDNPRRRLDELPDVRSCLQQGAAIPRLAAAQPWPAMFNNSCHSLPQASRQVSCEANFLHR